MPTSTDGKRASGHPRPFQTLSPFSPRRRPPGPVKNYALKLRHLTLMVCFVFLAVINAQAQSPDDNKIWTTVGSDGTVDEASAGRVFFDHSIVQMGRPLVSGATSGNHALAAPPTISAVIRYNVTPVNGLFTLTPHTCTGSSCPGRKLTLRYLAVGSGARVAANLIEVDLASGVETTRLTFNSINFPSSNKYQVRSAPLVCEPLLLFDFKRKAYYIEATLTGNGIVAGSAAGIQIIKIESGFCLG
jgi:hypothetical protein